MVDPSSCRRIEREASDPRGWHRGHGQECWMSLPGMYGAVHAWRDPATKKWIAWVRSGKHSYPPCPTQKTRIAAAINRCRSPAQG